MAGSTKARVMRYGFARDADVSASRVTSLGTHGMRYLLRLPTGAETWVTTPALGRHSVHNGLAAAAVGHVAGLDADAIARGLARGSRAAHRTTLVETARWWVLDDSYNAAPDSMAAALELLGQLPGRRVAVLGEMLELGDGTREAHRAVGRLAPDHADRLVVVGASARDIASGALERGMDPTAVTTTPDRTSAIELLLATSETGDTILVKASRGASLDELVDALVAAGGVPRGRGA
jgi:UDP-N-acetylmuramoyl-tripeptide--D-alanyl-D-alanine ligase